MIAELRADPELARAACMRKGFSVTVYFFGFIVVFPLGGVTSGPSQYWLVGEIPLSASGAGAQMESP